MIDNELDALLGKEDNGHNKRKSLGRGLGALLGEDDNLDFENTETIKAQQSKVDINQIVPGKYQPRTEFDQEALNSLAASVRDVLR